MNTWSTEIAYAIGLITTDGNLSKDKRHITLTSTDIDQLQTFCRCLNLKNRICLSPPGSYSKNRCYKVQFSNVRFYNWLLTIGLMANKTFNLLSLTIPDKYFPDFLRGHLDGDGSVIYYVDRHNKYKGKTYTYNRLYITFRSCSLSHIKWLQESINRILDIKGSLSGWRNKKKKNRKTLWTLRFCKKDSLVLLNYIYYKTDLPCLLRKKNIADNFLKLSNMHETNYAHRGTRIHSG